MASDALKIVTLDDPDLWKGSPARTGAGIPVLEIDSTQLISLLGDIDGLKAEIHERMRRAEAVKQAKSVLIEDAMRTEALNKKMAEIGKVMSAVHAALPFAEPDHADASLAPTPALKSAAEPAPQPIPVVERIASETLPWLEPEGVDEVLETLEIVPEELELAAPAEAIDSPAEEEPEAAASLAVEPAIERLDPVELAARRAEEVALEARRLADDTTARLDLAERREQQAIAELQTAQAALTALVETTQGRLAEAERCWKQTEDASREAREEATEMLRRSAAELLATRRREEEAAANLEAFRQECKATYELGRKRLEEAEHFWQKGDQAARQAQHLIDQTTAELLQARSAEETATAELNSARQELTTAYQFAAVAAQRRLDAVDFFRKMVRYSVFATAFSWIAMAWTVWFSLRATAPLWTPLLFSALIVLVAILTGKLGKPDAEAH